MLQTHLLKDTRRRTREKEKLERRSKAKEESKARYKRPVKSSTSSQSSTDAKSKSSNDPGIYNMQVLEFINSSYVQSTVFPDEASFTKGMIDKINGIA